MCRRYSFSHNVAELVRELRVEPVALQRTYNVSPSTIAPVVAQRHGEAPRIEFMRWGLVPWWAPDESGAQNMITEPSEAVALRPALRAAFHQRRCLVIADGFYEIGEDDAAPPPWRFTFPEAQEPMLLAGIWESWRPLGAREPVHTFCILTTRANATVEEVHHRMPVILAPRDWAVWLDPLTPVETLTSLLRPWPERLQAIPVTPRLRDPHFQGQECHEPHYNLG